MTQVVRNELTEMIWKNGLPRTRKPEYQGSVNLPLGTEVISSDCHWTIVEDIWYENFPAHLRNRAPRVWKEKGAWTIGFNGKSYVPPQFLVCLAEFDERPGAYDLAPRLADLDVEGVSQEMVFANLAFAFMSYPDFEVREWMWRIYGRYLADLETRSRGRFHGIPVIPNWWDPSKAGASVEELAKLGSKALMLPNNPGKFLDGRPITYGSPELDPLWSAIEDSGLPLCFHIGETHRDGPGGNGTMFLMNLGGFREQLGMFIFAGVFDRHPRLKVLFAEAGITWAVSALHDADVACAAHHDFTGTDAQFKLRPREYWEKHCYTTFMNDPIGLGLLDHVGGPDHVLWGSDYPHGESTLSYGWQAMQAVVDATSPEDAKKILGGNAKRLFNLS
jgi:predicted TIM-barrel fold metal-dependent hydrolase